jgi:hypothetical protein
MCRPGRDGSSLEGLALKEVIVIEFEPTIFDAVGNHNEGDMEACSLI